MLLNVIENNNCVIDIPKTVTVITLVANKLAYLLLFVFD